MPEAQATRLDSPRRSQAMCGAWVMSVELLSTETALPDTTLSFEDTQRLLPLLTGGEAEVPRWAPTAARTRINRRHLIMPVAELARRSGPRARSLEYETTVCELGKIVATKALAASGVPPLEIRAILTVSCTGYMLPSVDAHLIPALGLTTTVRRIPITELGCSAGVAALSLAGQLVPVLGGPALVVSVELCSLCLQTEAIEPSDVLGNLLFADAAAAAVVGEASEPHGPALLASRSVLWPDSTRQLGMKLSDTGLRLVLSPEVPDSVQRHLPATLESFLASQQLTLDDIRWWVVHPGGPKILEAVGECLRLPEGALAPSWSVWQQCGNVSSATVFFIARAIRAMSAPPRGSLGLMMAFGPGLSCELLLLRADGWIAGA